jgi:hypothetical protein
MVHFASIAKDVNPQIARAAAEVGLLLDDYHYSPHARDRIVRYTIAHGTPSGCPELDREDESDACLVFESELEPVPYDSPAWERDTSVILDAAMLADGSHPFPIPTVGDDDRTEPDDFAAAALEDLDIMPISGGAPDGDEAEPFEPTAEDLADFGKWSEELDRRREMLSWYERNPIRSFNADRLD